MATNVKLDRLIETNKRANELLLEHGLAQQGWTFKFAKDKRTVGWCRHHLKQIEVSKYYIDSHPDEIEDTILHEIAHALVGSRHGHDHVWRMKCIEIGANPTRTTDVAVYNGDFNYTVTCLECGTKWGKHRLRSGFLQGYHCKFCKGPLTVVDLRTGDIYKTKGGE